MTSKLLYLHNPKCSTSRNGLALLREKGVEVDMQLYLEHPLSAEQIERLVLASGKDVEALVRTKEAQYKEVMGIKNLTPKRAIRLLTKYPQLMERPILLTDQQHAVGRPIENLLTIL
ncbi:MAG: arsenate reductase (glutaredoxin) [Cryomorphaceae bacterium]|nr:arsenate reductase (glutaredoxin) [Cryomorphaceae bacterium]